MAKLNSDNKDTMPITDAVYGNRPKVPAKPERGRRSFATLADVFERAGLATLAGVKRGKR